MDETPKKFSESSDKCFLCSQPSKVNNKIFVFGKSSADLPSLITAATSVDLNAFTQIDDLFVCKNDCYKVLLKLRNSIDKCDSIKAEIKGRYEREGQVRIKRLRRPDSYDGETQQHRSGTVRSADTSTRSGATISLLFGDSTTCTSSIDYGDPSLFLLLILCL